MIDLLNGDRVVSAKERRFLIPYSDAHWNRMEKAGKVPRRLRLGDHRVGWSLRALQNWINDQQERAAAQL